MQKKFKLLEDELGKRIIGQPQLVQRLLVTLLADGHLLVEGAPGLAKTRAVKTLSSMLDATFQRIQFTPDLLPSDITGSEIFRPESGQFEFLPGPVFNQLVLADEINRAPAKVQSALLEAMAERQVSVGGQTYKLPPLFMVMATRNPIEQEGTYRMPEAQLDRFLIQLNIAYPDARSENAILELSRAETADPLRDAITPLISEEEIQTARSAVMKIHMSTPLQEYLVQLVQSTRQPQGYIRELNNTIAHGASPRATIALDRCARARAWLSGRDYATPDDVQAYAHDCLRHRLVLSFAAESRGIEPDAVIDQLLDQVPVG
ncbi:AAA family ATPase [Chromatiales bacterium (ex Bugula neritina AB1)]|nr:AAA family ATPase [Chromatiales bacterium (ex Bugula neritina AB1)]